MNPAAGCEGPELSAPLAMGPHIVALRNQLAQRFPHLRQQVSKRKRGQTLATGIEAMDELLDGGLSRGCFTELIALGPGSGSTEVMHQYLRQVAHQGSFLALVDGQGTFDVCAVEAAILSRLLWVRCQHTEEALKVIDLLLRDRNFPFLAIDLKMNPMRELRKISASIWFRYARLLEQNQTTVLVVTPQPSVGVAAYRLSVESNLGLSAITQARSELLSGLRFTLLRAAVNAAEFASAQVG